MENEPFWARALLAMENEPFRAVFGQICPKTARILTISGSFRGDVPEFRGHVTEKTPKGGSLAVENEPFSPSFQ